LVESPNFLNEDKKRKRDMLLGDPQASRMKMVIPATVQDEHPLPGTLHRLLPLLLLWIGSRVKERLVIDNRHVLREIEKEIERGIEIEIIGTGVEIEIIGTGIGTEIVEGEVTMVTVSPMRSLIPHLRLRLGSHARSRRPLALKPTKKKMIPRLKR